jgi:hypothetical protein
MAQPVFPATIAYDHNKGSYVEEYTPSQTAGETFGYGDLVTLSGATVLRCGADPATILGISEVVSESARVLTPNGRVPIRVLGPEAVIVMSSLTVPVMATHLNVAYGVARDANGIWQVDVSDTTNTRVVVVRLEIALGFWYVKFLAANLLNDGVAS